MIDSTPSLFHLLPIFLYAETHYRFRYFFSYLRKREPEILADTPHRIEPSSHLPILILIKDAHQYPIEIKDIIVEIRSNKTFTNSRSLFNKPLNISDKFWWRIFNIPLHGFTGKIECDVKFIISDGTRERIYHNDNYRTSSHKPLSVFIAESPIPKFRHLYFGECHSHSSYTDDQVEYGAPIKPSIELSKAMGHSFFCVTDHSYDLDDAIDDYLINDSALPKWKKLQREIDYLNSQYDNFAIIRGEEVTCRNVRNQNVHLLLLGNRTYFYGSGDSAEKWLDTSSENNISDVLDKIDIDTIAFAAHPKETVSILQKVLLHRGNWSKNDFIHSKLNGIQFANGSLTSGFWEGYQTWIDQLLQGKKVIALAGNDAHGNFNRFRQIGIPFLRIREHTNQLFGKMKTGAFLNDISEYNIVHAIKSGKVIISDGPVLNLIVKSKRKTTTSIGQLFTQKGNYNITINARSSNEFGHLNTVTIKQGIIGQREKTIFQTNELKVYEYDNQITIKIETNCYIRAEVWTNSKDTVDSQTHFCLSNPIWFMCNNLQVN